MVEFDRVDDEASRALDALADEIVQSRRLAGLSAFRQEAGEGLSGVVIEVDRGDEAAGGVYVSWRPGSRLISDAGDALLQDRLTDPAIQTSGVIKGVMKDAVTSILVVLGFTVDDPDDDMRPLSIRVTQKAG